MPNPKRRHSKARGRWRRTHYKADIPNPSTCSNCKKPKLPHKICPNCGYYNGRPVVQIKQKEKKKKK